MQRKTIEQWQEAIGEQVRAARIDADLAQAELADLANVSVNTIRNLEAGRSVSTATLIAVVRALGLADWFDTLAPTEDVSPLAMYDSRNRIRRRVRVSPRQGKRL